LTAAEIVIEFLSFHALYFDGQTKLIDISQQMHQSREQEDELGQEPEAIEDLLKTYFGGTPYIDRDEALDKLRAKFNDKK